jgi:Mce-associated membrane protein
MSRHSLRKREAAPDPPEAEVVVDEPVTDASAIDDAEAPAIAARGMDWPRTFVYGVLPALALLLAVGAGYLNWQDSTARADDTARIESLQAAKDSTIALLSYQPNTVEQQLGAARGLLTGNFRDAYTQLITDVVIPGAKQREISATATVPAIAPVSADEEHAVAIVFVNQTTVVGKDAPTASSSSVRVAMDKVNGHWLISEFDPV